MLMIISCRLYYALCLRTDSILEVVAYELDVATQSEKEYVHKFIKRTGVDRDFYIDGMNRIEDGSYADQITDGLNDLCIALSSVGYSMDTIIMIRCTIVGYIISKSQFAESSRPLLGFDLFYR